MDIDKTGLLTYSQFLFATLDPAILHDSALIEQHFRTLDTLREGFLTKQSLKKAIQRKGLDIKEETIEEAFVKSNLPSDVRITLDIFKDLYATF